jgi:hypothetical protein
MLTVEGFQDKIQALQFEWALHHMKGPRGPTGRMQKLLTLLRKKQWTRPSPLAASVPLTIHVRDAPPPPPHVSWTSTPLPEHCRVVMDITSAS